MQFLLFECTLSYQRYMLGFPIGIPLRGIGQNCAELRTSSITRNSSVIDIHRYKYIYICTIIVIIISKKRNGFIYF